MDTVQPNVYKQLTSLAQFCLVHNAASQFASVDKSWAETGSEIQQRSWWSARCIAIKIIWPASLSFGGWPLVTPHRARVLPAHFITERSRSPGKYSKPGFESWPRQLALVPEIVQSASEGQSKQPKLQVRCSAFTISVTPHSRGLCFHHFSHTPHSRGLCFHHFSHTPHSRGLCFHHFSHTPHSRGLCFHHFSHTPHSRGLCCHNISCRLVWGGQVQEKDCSLPLWILQIESSSGHLFLTKSNQLHYTIFIFCNHVTARSDSWQNSGEKMRNVL